MASNPTTARRQPPRPIRRTLRAAVRGMLWLEPHLRKPLLKITIVTLLLITVPTAATLFFMKPWFEVVVNRSDSLSGWVYFLDKRRPPRCGDTTAFDMPVDERFYRGWRLIKIISGCPGDTVTVVNRAVFVNGQPIGEAMPTSSNGEHELFVIAPGTIPPGHVYLSSTHPNSFDARYRSFGLRTNEELLGTAYRIF